MKPTMFLLFSCAPGYDRYISVFLLILFFLAMSLVLSALPKKGLSGKIFAGVMAIFFFVCTFFLADFLTVATFFPQGIYHDFGLGGNLYRLCWCTLAPMLVVFTGCKIALWRAFPQKVKQATATGARPDAPEREQDHSRAEGADKADDISRFSTQDSRDASQQKPIMSDLPGSTRQEQDKGADADQHPANATSPPSNDTAPAAAPKRADPLAQPQGNPAAPKEAQ